MKVESKVLVEAGLAGSAAGFGCANAAHAIQEIVTSLMNSIFTV